MDQTISNWELIIIDDGSDDDTYLDYIKHKDNRVKYFYQKNQERSVAKNNGIIKSNGKWITFLDSDDYFKINHLETFYKYIVSKDLSDGFIASNYSIRIGNKLKNNKFKYPLKTQHPVKFILANNSIGPFVCINKEIFKKNNFNVKYNNWEDAHLWCRIASLLDFHLLPNHTYVADYHDARGINSKTDLKRVKNYISIIKDLFQNYASILPKEIDTAFKKKYIDEKIEFNLYITSQNKQLIDSLGIWFLYFNLNPSIKKFIHLLRILANKIGLGIHKK